MSDWRGGGSKSLEIRGRLRTMNSKLGEGVGLTWSTTRVGLVLLVGWIWFSGLGGLVVWFCCWIVIRKRVHLIYN